MTVRYRWSASYGISLNLPAPYASRFVLSRFEYGNME